MLEKSLPPGESVPWRTRTLVIGHEFSRRSRHQLLYSKWFRTRLLISLKGTEDPVMEALTMATDTLEFATPKTSSMHDVSNCKYKFELNVIPF